MNIRRKLAALMVAASLLFAFAGPVSAHTVSMGQGSSCASGQALFYGNASYDQLSHPGKTCFSSITTTWNFSSFSDSDNGNCPGFLGFDNGLWDNCITSLTVTNVNSSHVLCLYNNQYANSGGGGLVIVGNWSSSQLSSTYNDNLSSFKWEDKAADCSHSP